MEKMFTAVWLLKWWCSIWTYSKRNCRMHLWRFSDD